MPNNLLTPGIIARQALATLYESTVMSGLVHRDYEAEFVRKVGDTITVREPAVFEATEFDRTNGIQIQDATENGIPVTLNHFADVSFTVTAEQWSLEIEDFEAQLLGPAMEAIAQKIDRDGLALRAEVSNTVGVPDVNDGGDNLHEWSNPRVLIDAGRVLTENNVPMTERRAVVGPNISARWLDDDLFNRADARGDTEGLQEANLGRRVFGFDPYMTQNIRRDQAAGTEIGIAFHRTALALVTRPLALPRGASDAAIESYRGFGLRVVSAYDVSKKVDIVSVDCLYGWKVLDPKRAVLIGGATAAPLP